MADDDRTRNSDAPVVSLDASPDDPTTFWNDYFAKRRPRPKHVADLVLRLNVQRKHDHVVAVIRAALIHGQSQPWMYDVLATTLKILGRPTAEVERALLSRVDFTAVDVPSMLYSAAYLTRFGAEAQALTLYRQASRLAPTRPEPYVLGLKLARQARDVDAVRWAAGGILTYAWTKDHPKLHQLAEDAAAEARSWLLVKNRQNDAVALDEAMRQARQRDLVMKLTWAGQGDLDLIVEEPLGTTCSFENPQSPGGGVLVHDGRGPDQKKCYEHYVCAFGAPGTYRIRVQHVSGDIVGKRARLMMTLYRGTPRETKRSIPVRIGRVDQIVRLSLKQGRRTELAAAETE